MKRRQKVCFRILVGVDQIAKPRGAQAKRPVGCNALSLILPPGCNPHYLERKLTAALQAS